MHQDTRISPAIAKTGMISTAELLVLAADAPQSVISILKEKSALAVSQDEHGYSLMHAAASYSHPDLLRALVKEFHVDVNLKDEDGETALFVVETAECARVLVEELHADIKSTADDGKMALERMYADGESPEFPEVAAYLALKQAETVVNTTTGDTSISPHPPPPLPAGVSINIGTMAQEDAGEVSDPQIRRQIEELASRDDFEEESGQKALRELIASVIQKDPAQERNVRPRTD